MSKETYQMVFDSDVADLIGKIKIVDVRPDSYYVEGHIPTAINVPFDEIATEDGDLDENIVKAFEDAGISPDEEFVVACQVGYHSKLASDALYDAGYKNLRFYPGSYEDWILNPDHPIEK